MLDNWTVTAYCYDNADRLTSTTDPTIGTNVAYDSHGNTTVLGGETIFYDGADRHVATVTATGAVRYVRDATDRIVARMVGGVVVARYSFCGPGDSPCATLDATNTVVERTVGVAGGALVTERAAGDVWSYPNIHGDVVATADAAGAKQGNTLAYDPYGVALAGLPDNSAGAFDYGWLGTKQRGVEHDAGITTIEMGARQCSPGIAWRGGGRGVRKLRWVGVASPAIAPGER